MKITLDVSKTLEENAEIYFERAKKAKKKLQGALKALNDIQQKINKLKEDLSKREGQEDSQADNNVDISNNALKGFSLKQTKQQNKHWFERFRWCFLPSKTLMVAGRDATSNEVLIKKYTNKQDIVLHCEIKGSPFVVVKSDILSKQELELAADFAVTFSKAWKSGFYNYDVAVVRGFQVSKKPKAGEYLPKGAFMIYGSTKKIVGKLNLAVGVFERKAMSGPIEAVKSLCKKYVILKPGNKKASDIARIISKKLHLKVDDVLRALPSGGFDFL